MRSFLKIAAVFLAIVFLSALLAPILFRFLDFKFERIFNRLVMIFSLVAVILFVRFRRAEWDRMGLRWTSRSLKGMGVAFAVGIGVLGLLILMRLVTGTATWTPRETGLGEGAGMVMMALATGIFVGLIEEIFFRGFVYHGLRHTFGWNLVASIVVTSSFYSLIHFVNATKPYIGPEPHFVDSLKLMMAPLQSLGKWREYWREAVGLFFFGTVLNLLVWRTRSLYPAIGLHAGCVFFIKLDGAFLFYSSDNPFWIGAGGLVDGVLAWALLGGLGVLIVKSRLFRPITAGVLLALTGLMVPFAVANASQEGSAVLNEEPLYVFEDHLDDAQTVLLFPGQGPHRGVWQKDGFLFAGVKEAGEITVKIVTIAGEEQKAVVLPPVEGGINRLCFSEVAIGSKLVLEYGLEIEEPIAKERSYLYLRLWIGQHEIRRLVIPTETGWRREIIDLGVLSFLKGHVPVTFELRAAGTETRQFAFRAAMYP